LVRSASLAPPSATKMAVLNDSCMKNDYQSRRQS
jgi:hypothetical protein